MPYSPATIANYFLQRASKEGRALTPMQVLKLVYIAHGWHLGFRKEPLIDESVEAWRHGPAIRSLYNKIKNMEAVPLLSCCLSIGFLCQLPLGQCYENRQKIGRDFR
ncbi:Panacea domain-containing protein [Xylella fastidiosa]|uniref:Panacea domain-containing protein n=1 Tax=Xylella fastidiosa TaxID=2371 RepID=UPI0034DF85ED